MAASLDLPKGAALIRRVIHVNGARAKRRLSVKSIGSFNQDHITMAPSPSSGLHLEIFTPKSDFFLLDFMTYFITWHDIVELFYYPKWSKIIKSPRWDLNSIFNWINSTEIINLKNKYFLNELIIALRISHGYVCGVHNEGGGQLKWISTR